MDDGSSGIVRLVDRPLSIEVNASGTFSWAASASSSWPSVHSSDACVHRRSPGRLELPAVEVRTRRKDDHQLAS
jgi:hypothetical protein